MLPSEKRFLSMVLPILLTEIREEVEDPDISWRITELKFDFSSKGKTVTGLGIFFSTNDHMLFFI